MSYFVKQKCKPTRTETYDGISYTLEKDVAVEVTDINAVAYLLARTAHNQKGQPIVKIVLADSAEDTFWHALVNDENNEPDDYDLILPDRSGE